MRIHVLLLVGLALKTTGIFGQAAFDLNAIEIHAYIDQQAIPRYEPIECPIVNEQQEVDQLALDAVNTVMYELVNFWGDETVEGVEGGVSEEEAVYWKIAKQDLTSYELIVKTKGIILGQKITSYLEQQIEEQCFNWALVFNNEQLVVEENRAEPEAEQLEEIVALEGTVEAAEPTIFDPYSTENLYAATAVQAYDAPVDENEQSISELEAIYTTENEFARNVSLETEVRREEEEFRNAFSAMMPAPSTETILPADFFRSAQTLGTVEAKIVEVLDSRGYVNKGYFEFDHGFMITTQLEATNPNGAFKTGKARYPSPVTFNQSLSFTNYLNSLFLPAKGTFRMFAIYVESAPNRSYSDNNGIDYSVGSYSMDASRRKSRLSEALRNQPYSQKTDELANVKVLVYECATDGGSRIPRLMEAKFSGKDHLIRTGLWTAFNE